VFRDWPLEITVRCRLWSSVLWHRAVWQITANFSGLYHLYVQSPPWKLTPTGPCLKTALFSASVSTVSYSYFHWTPLPLPLSLLSTFWLTTPVLLLSILLPRTAFFVCHVIITRIPSVPYRFLLRRRPLSGSHLGDVFLGPPSYRPLRLAFFLFSPILFTVLFYKRLTSKCSQYPPNVTTQKTRIKHFKLWQPQISDHLTCKHVNPTGL
jgi:hypothetical protein